jgi:hypothetical protein
MFKSDNELSKKYEIKLGKYFERKGYKVEYAPDKIFYDWDLLIDKTIGIEVKVDKHKASLKDNPNILIEWMSGGHPSGIQQSNSKWYVYFFILTNKTYKVNVEKLKEYINQDHIKGGIKKYDKADNMTFGYIIPIKDLIDDGIAKRIVVN